MKALTLAFLISLAALAQETPKGQFTARELFYSAAQAPATPVKSTKAAAAPAKKKSVESAARVTPPPTPPTSTDAKNVTMTTSPAPRTVADAAQVIPAVAVTAPAPTEGPALGLRYTILKRSGGEMVEVAPDTVFHAEDRIQFAVETNGPGYLYIVSQGSSGTWKPMFPSADVESGSNRVDGFRSYTMPPKSRLVFDEQPGTEKIFIVFSRQPEQSLEETIYSLQAPKTQPAQTPAPKAAPESKKLLVASIDDGMVGKLRESYTRDLIVEKVDEATPGDRKEKAVYVVNPTGSRDSRVVADLRLAHQ